MKNSRPRGPRPVGSTAMAFRGIAINSKRKAGKDAAYLALTDMLPGIFRRVAFADELKRELMQLARAGQVQLVDAHGAPNPQADLFNDSVKEANRQVIMDHAVLRGGSGKSLVWVTKAFERLEKLPVGMIPVVTDLRFRNEAQYLREHGYLLARLECPDEERFRRGASRVGIADVSECELDDYPDFDVWLRSDQLAPKAIATALLERFDPV